MIENKVKIPIIPSNLIPESQDMEALESMVLNTMEEQIAENEHGDMSPLIDLHHQVEHLNAKLFATTMSNLHILHQYRSIL